MRTKFPVPKVRDQISCWKRMGNIHGTFRGLRTTESVTVINIIISIVVTKPTCFPTPELIVNLRRAERKTRAGSQLSSTVLNDGKDRRNGACVSLLVECHPVGFDRVLQEQANVAHQA